MLIIQTIQLFLDIPNLRIKSYIRDINNMCTKYNSKEYFPHNDRSDIIGLVSFVFSKSVEI